MEEDRQKSKQSHLHQSEFGVFRRNGIGQMSEVGFDSDGKQVDAVATAITTGATLTQLDCIGKEKNNGTHSRALKGWLLLSCTRVQYTCS